MQETLCPLQACEDYVLVYIAQRFVVIKIQFTLSPAHSRQQSKAERIALPSELLEVLTSQKRNEFDHVITSDES
jgi:hypothetical protein